MLRNWISMRPTLTHLIYSNVKHTKKFGDRMETFERRQIKWIKANHSIRKTKRIGIVCLSIVNVLVMPINSDGVNSFNKTTKKKNLYNIIHFQNKKIHHQHHQLSPLPSSFHQT